LDGFAELLLEGFEAVGQSAGLTKRFRYFADVTSALVHGFQKAFERIGESLVTFRAAEAPGFFEISLGEAAAGAFDFDAAGGLFDFLGGAEAQEEIGER